MIFVLGLGYRMRVGKDSVADVLVERYGFRRYGFAEALKVEVLERFRDVLDVVARETYGSGIDHIERAREALVRDLKPSVVRALLQNYGTEVRRRDDPQYWVDMLHTQILHRDRPTRAVVTDVRFRNEAAWVHGVGGLLVRVDRGAPEQGSVSAHTSERDLAEYLGWDYILKNDGTLDDLSAAVDRMVGLLLSLRGMGG